MGKIIDLFGHWKTAGYQEALRSIMQSHVGPGIKAFKKNPPDSAYEKDYNQALEDLEAWIKARIK